MMGMAVDDGLHMVEAVDRVRQPLRIRDIGRSQAARLPACRSIGE